MERVIYREKQQMNELWFHLSVVAMGAFLVYVNYQEYLAAGTINLWAVAISVLLLISMVSLTLNTTITDREIRVGFWFYTKNYPVADVVEAYSRTYVPIGEYGGWGLKGRGRNKSFTMYGNQGLQLVMKDGKRVLIGTQQPEIIEQAMQDALAEQLDTEEEVELDLERLKDSRYRIKR